MSNVCNSLGSFWDPPKDLDQFSDSMSAAETACLPGSRGFHSTIRTVLENHLWYWPLQNVRIFYYNWDTFYSITSTEYSIVSSFSRIFCLTPLMLGFKCQWGWSFSNALSWPPTAPNSTVFQEPFMTSKPVPPWWLLHYRAWLPA